MKILDENDIEINELERYYIQFYNSFKNGYNMNVGGQDGLAYFKTWNGLIDPNGNEMPPIENLSQFCRENNLQCKSLRAIFSGDKCSHKGWTCKTGRNRKINKGNLGKIKSRESKKKLSRSLKEYFKNNTSANAKIWPGIIFPTGEVMEKIISLDKFCKENNLSRSTFRRWFLFSDKIEWNGWKKLTK